MLHRMRGICGLDQQDARAPLIGGTVAALFYRYMVPTEVADVPPAIAEGEVERTTATP
jgi:hypothetical protein